MKNCNLDLSSIILEVIKAPKNCVYQSGNQYKLIDLIPAEECLFALHEVIPYYLTLMNKGYFKWQNNPNAVITQCPNPEVAVAIGVKCELKNKNKKIQAKVVATKTGKCPKKYQTGKEILKKVINNKKICLLAFDVFLPSILFLETNAKKRKKVKPIIIQCSYGKDPAIFKLKLGSETDD